MALVGKIIKKISFFLIFIFFNAFAYVSNYIAPSLEDYWAQEFYLLTQQYNSRVGQPAYDLAYANLAFKLKKYLIANLAFDRVLDNQPHNMEAALGLAASFYCMKRFDEAQYVYEKILSINKKDGALRYYVNNLIMHLAEARRRELTEFHGFLGGAFTYDTNVAAGIPSLISTATSLGLGSFAPPPPPPPPTPSVASLSAIVQPTPGSLFYGGVNGQHLFTPRLYGFFQMDGFYQWSWATTRYDFAYGEAFGFLNYERSNWIVTAEGGDRRVFFDHSVLRNESNYGVELTKRIANHYVGAFVQHQNYRYPLGADSFNGWSTDYYLNWVWIMKEIPYTLKVTPRIGEAYADDHTINYAFANTWGLNMMLGYDGFQNVRPELYFNYLRYRFNGFPPSQSFRRFDKFKNITLMLPIILNKYLRLIPAGSYYYNKSNDSAFQYRRWIGQIAMEYDF